MQIFNLCYIIAFRLYENDGQRDFNFDEIVKEITYFKGTSYYINEFCMTNQYVCPTGNFSELAIFVSFV